MKQFCIFLIIYSLGAPVILGRPSLEDRKNKIFLECELELNIDATAFVLGTMKKIGEKICMLACLARRATVEDLIEPDNKTTLYNGFVKLIDKAYEKGFANSGGFAQQYLVNHVETCYAIEWTGCGFMKCVEFIESPMDGLMEFAIDNNLLINIYNIS